MVADLPRLRHASLTLTATNLFCPLSENAVPFGVAFNKFAARVVGA